jgi:hypothetical protein
VLNGSYSDLLFVAQTVDGFDLVSEAVKVLEHAVLAFISVHYGLLYSGADPLLSFSPHIGNGHPDLSLLSLDPFQLEVDQELVDPVVEFVSFAIEEVRFGRVLASIGSSSRASVALGRVTSLLRHPEGVQSVTF